MRTSLPAFARLRLAQTNNRTKKRYRSGVAFFAPSPYGMRCRSFGSPARRAVLRGQRQRDSSLWTPVRRLRAGSEAGCSLMHKSNMRKHPFIDETECQLVAAGQ